MDLKPGYKRTDVGVIPEDWEVKPLAELFTFQNGVNANKAAYGSGTPFINVLEVISYPFLTEDAIPGRIELSSQAANRFAVQHGDVLFNRTSETQQEVGLAAVYIGTGAVVFGGFVIRARPRSYSMTVEFSAYNLRLPIVRSQIIALGQGAVRANVGQQDLSRVLIPLPTKAEQEAIAEALSDADALIESLEQLLTKKRQIKQGAMQELLTGKRRLPGFQSKCGYKQTEVGTIPEDWEISAVGEEFSVQLGKMLDSEKNIGVPKPFLGNRAVQWGRIYLSDIGVVRLTPFDLQRFRLRGGDLLVCEGGEIGRCAVWQEPVEECYYQKALHRLRANAIMSH